MSARNKQTKEGELRTTVLPSLHFHEMREDMSLQMVHFDDRLARSGSQALGERRTDQERSQQAGAAGKSDGIHLVERHIGLTERFRNDRQDVLLVGTGSQFGDYAAITAVDLLGGHHVGEQIFVAQDGCGRVVAG